MPKVALTLQLIAQICQRIQAGAFEQVAVESLGVPLPVYKEWLARGQRKGARGLARRLVDGVTEAKAYARFMAEMHLREQDEKTWLLNGPGRDAPDQPGWGPAGKAASVEDNAAFVTLLLELCAILVEALAPWPEARVAAAAAVERWAAEKGHERP